MMLTFLEPVVLVLLLLILPFLWLRKKRQVITEHPQVSLHLNLRSIPLIGRLPGTFLALALLCLVLSLAKPVLPKVNEMRVIETRDILIAIDISGSMDAMVAPQVPADAVILPPQRQTAGGIILPGPYRRIDAAADAAWKFTDKRREDRVGLLVFNDDSYYHWPLTNDTKIILRKLRNVNSFTGGGTNFDGLGAFNQGKGPVFAGFEHFFKYGKAQTKVLIMVTDGESSINAERMERLEELMRSVGGKIYVLGVGESWTGSQNFSFDMTKDIRELVRRLNGQCFAAADASQMTAAFEAINNLEKSKVKLEQLRTYRDIYSWFLLAAALLFILYLASSALIGEEA